MVYDREKQKLATISSFQARYEWTLVYGETFASCLAQKKLCGQIWPLALKMAQERPKTNLDRFGPFLAQMAPFCMLIEMRIVSMDTGKRITSVNKHSIGHEIYFLTRLYIASPPCIAKKGWARRTICIRVQLSDKAFCNRIMGMWNWRYLWQISGWWWWWRWSPEKCTSSKIWPWQWQKNG